MPVLNLPEIDPAASLDCDICIIGTGPAGATLARELAGSRQQIIVLESGGRLRQPDADALNEIENIGWPRILDQWLVRNRILGGSSHTWSGRCVPFDEIDLEARPWVPHSGWPLTLAELTPYLDRSAAYLGLGPGRWYTDERFWQALSRQPPFSLDGGPLTSFFWQFSRDVMGRGEHTRFGIHLPGQLGPNIRLLTDATVTQIEAGPTGQEVTAVEVTPLAGPARRITARRVVLCAGGIENARLLLNSNRTLPAGLGNQHGQVGRYLTDHLRGPVGTFAVAGSAGLQKLFGHYRMAGGHVFSHGLALRPEIQRSAGLLNCAAWLEGEISGDDPFYTLKRLARRQVQPRDALNLAANAGLLARAARDYYLSRTGLPRKINQLKLVCMAEQLPDPESRVTLADATDRFGQPLPRIDWRVHELEARTLRQMATLVAQEFARLRFKPLQLADWVQQEGPVPQSFQDVAHPTGTTRMGVHPTSSVVDAQCQVHGVSGLYIGGSSVFPTSGHANPTQMIVALALRLADRLKQQPNIS